MAFDSALFPALLTVIELCFLPLTLWPGYTFPCVLISIDLPSVISQVLDSAKNDKKLGNMTYPLKNLLTAKDLTVNRPFQLSGSTPNAKVNLRLCLRVSPSHSCLYTLLKMCPLFVPLRNVATFLKTCFLFICHFNLKARQVMVKFPCLSL